MKVLGLPGINPATGPWLTAVLSEIGIEGVSASTQSYRCWEEPGSQMNMSREIESAATAAADMLVAKSVGTMVGMQGLSGDQLSPGFLVLIGVPHARLAGRQAGLLHNLDQFGIPVLVIQQTADPAGSYDSLAAKLPDSPLITTVAVAGNDHQYRDTVPV